MMWDLFIVAVVGVSLWVAYMCGLSDCQKNNCHRKECNKDE